ncbi:hypothetical protein Fot_22686 [Forsythia ovata]|uniref:Uncharacterized protein n=1 Tax=Forsythia ovata TaxID=205694 RepID=A0ABD1UYF2_9LAMI
MAVDGGGYDCIGFARSLRLLLTFIVGFDCARLCDFSSCDCAQFAPAAINISKETSEKAAQNCRLKKMKEPIVAEPRVDEWERVPKEWLRSHESLQGVSDKRNVHEEYKSIDVHKSAHAERGSDLHLHENSCDPLDDKFYTDDVIKQVEDIIQSVEKSKHTETIEFAEANVTLI